MDNLIHTTHINSGITPAGTKNITENGTHDVTNYASAEVNVAGIVPSGILPITENGTYDVTNYASAEVNVSSSAPTLRFVDSTYTANVQRTWQQTIQKYAQKASYTEETRVTGYTRIGKTAVDSSGVTVSVAKYGTPSGTVVVTPQVAEEGSLYVYSFDEDFTDCTSCIMSISIPANVGAFNYNMVMFVY